MSYELVNENEYKSINRTRLIEKMLKSKYNKKINLIEGVHYETMDGSLFERLKNRKRTKLIDDMLDENNTEL